MGPDEVRDRTSDLRDGRERSVLVLYKLALRAARGSASWRAASNKSDVCSSTYNAHFVNHVLHQKAVLAHLSQLSRVNFGHLEDEDAGADDDEGKNDSDDLTGARLQSLIEYLEACEILQTRDTITEHVRQK